MEESELTRKAIEELMTEMDEYKEKELMPTERKKNPLGRPNKLFLGRTINSIMNHNKRQADRNIQRCERKLKELDAKKTKHTSKKHLKDHYAKFEYSNEVISSDSDEFSSKTRRRKKRKLRKKNHRSRSTSSSSTSCSNETNSNKSSNSTGKSKIKMCKKKRHKHADKIKDKNEDYEQGFQSNYMEYYLDHNMAYAALAYSQMGNLLLQQQQLQQQVKVEEELEDESVEIPSDLNISCHSSPESSLNISLHSSSAEEDENGILTFKLSSDDDENIPIVPQSASERSKQKYFINDFKDEDSLHSHISLESKDSQKSVLKEENKIYELSSSDSDELEIVETTLENLSN